MKNYFKIFGIRHEGTEARSSGIVGHGGTEARSSGIVGHGGTEARSSGIVGHGGTETRSSGIVGHRGAEARSSGIVGHGGTEVQSSGVVGHEGTEAQSSSMFGNRDSEAQSLLMKISQLTIFKLPLDIILRGSVALCLILLFSVELQAQSIFPTFGSARSGTAGYQFTKVDVDARSAGMGHSAMADMTGGGSLFWNPALAVQSESSEVYGSHTSYFADIGMEYIGAIHKTNSFAFGLSMQYLSSGDILETNEFNPFGTGRTFQTTHLTAGLTVSQKLTNLFSYGLTLKYLQEDLEAITNSSAAIDLGFFYRVGDTGLSFAVSLTNFGFDSAPTGETIRTSLDGPVTENAFSDVTLPTTFNMAAAWKLMQSEQQGLTLTAQIQNPSDNAERMALGGEYHFRKQVFFRTGYRFGVDEANWPTFGVGLVLPVMNRSLRFDYAYASLERLGQTHRIALSIAL